MIAKQKTERPQALKVCSPAARIGIYPEVSQDGIGTYIQGIKDLVGAECIPCQGGILSPRAFFTRMPENFDLIHVPHFLVPFHTRGFKVVCTIQDIIPIVERGNVGFLKEKYLYFRIHWSLRKADHIIFTSLSTLNDVMRVFGKVGNHSVIPLAVEEPIEKQCISGSAYAFPYFFTVGRRRRHKNIEGILRAFAKVAITSRSHLVFGGKEDIHDKQWKSMAASLGILEKIHFTGFLTREELASHYRGAICLVFPSLYEGFGLPILEAMSYDCPVITSSTSSMPEVASDAAILVDPRDVNSISRAMLDLESDPALRSVLITKGRENSRRYSWKKTAESTMAVYQKTLKID